MGFSRALLLVALTATIFSTMAVATEFIVGDEHGWTTGFDYQAWAADKVFLVGDTLVFNYAPGKDNVIRVNGSDFVTCSVPPTAEPLTSGEDTIVLTSTGRRWYISGVGNHCNSGQKLFIIVRPSSLAEAPSSPIVPAPSPVPPPKASWSASALHFGRRVTRKLFKIFQ